MKKGDSIILPIRGLNVSKDIWGKDADEFKSVFCDYHTATHADNFPQPGTMGKPP